jgi:hypothetical protein
MLRHTQAPSGALATNAGLLATMTMSGTNQNGNRTGLSTRHQRTGVTEPGMFDDRNRRHDRPNANLDGLDEPTTLVLANAHRNGPTNADLTAAMMAMLDVDLLIAANADGPHHLIN